MALNQHGLPKGASTGSAAPNGPRTIRQSAIPSIKVAITIDDNLVDRMIFERVTKRSGLVETALCFRDAQCALEHLLDPQNPPVDVVLLDVNMPRMDGFEFLEAATQQLGPHFARYCAMMLTTPLNPHDQMRAATFAVMQGFINKPLTIADVEDLATRLSGDDPPSNAVVPAALI